MTDAEADDFELLDFPAVDDDAVRRAVRRGVLRVGFSAAAWLLLAVVAGTIAAGVVTAVRTPHFIAVVNDGITAAHPELDLHGMTGGGGLTSSYVRRDGQVRGDLGGSAQAVVQVRRTFFGRVDVDAGDPGQTPVGRALSRVPAGKAATRALVAKLPDTVVASAVVELQTPLPVAQIATVVPDGASAMILSPPPGTDEPDGTDGMDGVVGWPATGGDLSGFVRWADGLRPGDDFLLASIGLPSSVTLRKIAGNPVVYAVVVDGVTPAQLGSLLDNPQVRGVNLGDIAFDTTVQ